MKSRARMLLEKEYVKLQKEPLWGISAEPLNEDNFFVWEAKVRGLKDTMWEGGIFKLYLKFSEMYSCVPPQLIFTTIPFHPNVDISTGRPCVDFLDNADDWKQSYNIGYILLTLQTLLVNPVLENAVNTQAISVYLNNPAVYRQMVLNCVLASQRLDANLSPYVSNEDDGSPAGQPSEVRGEKTGYTAHLHASKISFEDYLSLWKGIATSNPVAAPNPLGDCLKNDSKLQNVHFELSQNELEHEIRAQLEEHYKLMYGRFEKAESGRHDKLDREPNRVLLLKHVYLSKPNTEATSRVQSTTPINDSLDFDKEADDLIQWTKSLSPEQINF